MNQVPIMSEVFAAGEQIDFLFWVGCAGNFDARAQKITRAFCKILDHVNAKYAILGDEEKCTGDPARRAGNEFLFQMLAIQNIETLNTYQIKNIVCTCPHCFNTLKNEYPGLGGIYHVLHYSEFLDELIKTGKLKVNTHIESQKVAYHDSCYLGRVNDVYEAPRNVLESLNTEIAEMTRSRKLGMCCGAGGAQMFKEEEKGSIRVNEERVAQLLDTGATKIIANCPFCITMLQDGVKAKDKQDEVTVYDISEWIIQQNIF